MDLPDIFRAPDTTDWVYLNNAASTKPLPALLEGYDALWNWAYLNPSAKGQASTVLKKAIARLQQTFLQRIGAGADDIIWTSGGTEANNLAIFGLEPESSSWVGAEVVTSVAEHASISQAVNQLEAKGARILRVPIDTAGQLKLDMLVNALTPLTRLVTLGLIHGETGVIQDLPAIRRIMEEHAPQALLHVDAVQALAKAELLWDEASVDLMSFSGHKFHAFGGVGALLVRRGINLSPMIVGGGQQNGLRSGSLDGAGILSFLIAANSLLDNATDYQYRIAELNRSLRSGLMKVTDKKGQLLAPYFVSPECASPFILNVVFPGYEGAVLMRILDSMGVTISTGSACSAESNDPSKVLTMMGIDRRLAFGAIRVSLGYYTSKTDITTFLKRFQESVLSY